MSVEIVPFGAARPGQSAYTWETDDPHGWGDYQFETVDPLTIYNRHDWDDDPPVMTRKLWTLVEIETVRFPKGDAS